MTIQTIDIINPISCESFWKNFYLKNKPVIIRDLFIKKEVGKITNVFEAVQLMSSFKMETIDVYKKLAVSDDSFKSADYWEFEKCIHYIRENTTEKLCTRNFLPEQRSHEFFGIPNYCTFRSKADISINLFLANANAFTHLHYDCDQHGVLLYQIFGKKRVTLIPVQEAKKLCPVLNQSWISFENFTEAEKKGFIDFSNAYDCILQPGDTLFIPPLIWHHVEYLDLAMSINYRFGRNDYNRFLAENIHGDMYTQNVAVKFNTKEAEEGLYDKYFQLIRKAFFADFSNETEKYRYLCTFFKKLYALICVDALHTDYYIGENDFLIDNTIPLLKMACSPYEKKSNVFFESCIESSNKR